MARTDDGMYTVEMEGVDVYDPVNNTIVDTGAAKVAAWFVDGDYDGRTFCITQAFFPDRSAWEKLSKALAGVVDPERFELLLGHRFVAVRRGQAQERRGEGDRPARQRGDASACSRRGREVGDGPQERKRCAGAGPTAGAAGGPAYPLQSLRRAARPLDLR